MGFGDDGYRPSRANIDSSTIVGGSLENSHQFTGSVHITASSTENSITTYGAISASAFLGDGSNLTGIAGGGGGDGNVTGVASSTDNAIVRFNGTGGKTIQNSGVTIDDSNNLATGADISGSSTLQIVGATVLGSTLEVSGTATLAGTTNAQALNAQALTATTISGSSTLEVVGATVLGSTLEVSGTATLAGTTNAQALNAQALTATTLSASSTLEIVGATVLGNTLAVSGNVTLGDAAADVTTVTSQLTASEGGYFAAHVGIGTTTPDELLHVGTDVAASGDATSKIRISQLANSISSRVNLVAGVIGATDPYFAIETRNGEFPHAITEKFRIDDSGSVGIGTSEPDKTLAVDGTFGCTGSATFKSNVTLGDAVTDVTTVTGRLTASVGMFVPDGEGISIQGHRAAPGVMLYAEATANGDGIRIDSDATSKFGCLVFGNNGDTSDYGLIALAGSSGGALPIAGVDHESLCFRTQGNDQQIAFSTDGGSSTVLVIDGTNVGIGPDVLAPGSTLTVVGSISGSSTLEIVGATVLGNTLAVSGNVTLAGTTNAQALTATTISGSSTLEIVGATVLGSTLAVSGTATLAGQLTASVGALISGSVGENVIIVANQGSSGAGGNTGPRGFALGVQNVQDYGSIRLEQHSTDEVTQRTAIFTKHYTNAEEDHLLIGAYTDASEAIVSIGGGLGSTGDFNSCTTLRLCAAADTTTTNTSPIVSITSTGQSTTGAISGSSTLAIGGVSTLAGNVLPDVDNSYDLGSASKRWANVYTGDLHLKNERGNWTILEEEDYLCVINNKTGKKFKMMLQEIED